MGLSPSPVASNANSRLVSELSLSVGHLVRVHEELSELLRGVGKNTQWKIPSQALGVWYVAIVVPISDLALK